MFASASERLKKFLVNKITATPDTTFICREQAEPEPGFFMDYDHVRISKNSQNELVISFGYRGNEMMYYTWPADSIEDGGTLNLSFLSGKHQLYFTE